MAFVKLRRGDSVRIIVPCSSWSAEKIPTPDRERGARWGKPNLLYIGVLKVDPGPAKVVRTIAASHDDERPNVIVLDVAGRVIAVPRVSCKKLNTTAAAIARKKIHD